jgi:hypothetical protein
MAPPSPQKQKSRAQKEKDTLLGAAEGRHRRFWESFTVKTKIPLNPPLEKGDFLNPLFQKGAGGIFLPGGDKLVVHECLSMLQHRLESLCHQQKTENRKRQTTSPAVRP